MLYVTCMTIKPKGFNGVASKDQDQETTPLMLCAVSESVCSQQIASLQTQNIVPLILLQLGITVCQLAPYEIFISRRKFSFSNPASATPRCSLWPTSFCACCSFINFTVIIVMKIVILQEAGWMSTNQSIMRNNEEDCRSVTRHLSSRVGTVCVCERAVVPK